jgi:bifunctional non-homologous end joining protein LigD
MEKTRRFVIQRHERQDKPVHWDLMLEQGSVLQTYQLDAPPEELANGATGAVRIDDHLIKFLTYQGSVNKGKGTVAIADSGTYRVLDEDADRRMIEFAGGILKGEFVLAHLNDDEWNFASAGGAD